MTKLTRTFHPVGQGAFYTERHETDNAFFNVIYDCGSKSLSTNFKEIVDKSLSDMNNHIDILFISHFHDDHVNGIKYLNKEGITINHVIIPFMTEEHKLLLKIYNKFSPNSQGQSIEELIDHPKTFFPKAKVHMIMPMGDEAENKSLDFLMSGSPLDLEKSMSGWHFIPFNYRHNERINVFKKELKKNGVDYSKLSEKGYILKYQKKIAKACSKVRPGDLNSNSLIVFSGPNKDDTPSIQSSCLYTGDANLKNRHLVSTLQDYIGKSYTSLGCIQVPHHGSKDSFSSQIYSQIAALPISVISCGISNQYNHPSDKVLKQVALNSSEIHIVTENPNSQFVQQKEY